MQLAMPMNVQKRPKNATRRKMSGAKENSLGLLTILLVIFFALYSAIYLNNTFPISEGWNVNYAELVLHGKVPYRDFYYYLPPLNILIDIVLWSLSFGSLLLYRIWWAAQRAVIFVMIFRLLSRYINKFCVFAACLLSIILCSASEYDLLGDYNQTTALLAVLLMYCVNGFCEAGTAREKYKQLFKAGVVLGLLFLNKQTIFLASGLVYLLALAFYCWQKKDTRFGIYCFLVIGGAAVPMVAMALYLLLNGAFIPFIEQVFMHTSGKGSIFTILFGGMSLALSNFFNWLIVALAILLVLCAQNESKLYRVARNIEVVLIPIFVLILYIQFQAEITGVVAAVRTSRAIQIILLIDLIAVLALLYFRVWKHALTGNMTGVVGLFLLVFTFIGVFICGRSENVEGTTFLHDVYTSTDVFQGISTKFYYIVFLLTVAILIKYGVGFTKATIKAEEALFWIFCAAFSSMYAGIMNAGTSGIPYFATMIAVPCVLSVVLAAQADNAGTIKLIKGIALVGCAVMVVGGIAQKVVCSYSWWGTKEEDMSKKIYTTDVPALKGFVFSEQDQKMFDGITELIEENTTSDSVIFGYPYIKIFNVLTNNYNMSDFVPVLFYDVVDDAYVLKEKKLLLENLPDIVIWKDIPYCKEVHESEFRDGAPLKQREIEKDFGEILATRYNLLGMYGEDNTGVVKVYKLNDAKAENEFRLKGDGTYDNPYLIETATDLENFSSYVNGGKTFEGQYIRQTADIDLKGQPFTPIGKFGGESYFFGVYDGAGHVIRNLSIQSDTNENEGLFGRLGGEVYNLGIENGIIHGGCVGVIASHSEGSDAKIVNCFTNVAVKASRAGGIADNFQGTIQNCVSLGDLQGEENADAITYNNAKKVENVYQLESSAVSLLKLASIQETRISYVNTEVMDSDFLVGRLTAYVREVNTKKQESDSAETTSERLTEEEKTIKLTEWQHGTNGHPALIPEN